MAIEELMLQKQPALDRQKSYRSHRLSLATGDRDLSENDLFGSTMAAVARSALIQKLVLLPKMKAAAFFQPEDHVDFKKAHKSVKAHSMQRVNTVQLGAVFTSGVGMFIVHDLVLHRMAHGQDMDTAPAVLSGFAGGCGGLVYALGATCSTNYMRYGYRTWSSSLGSCFRGIHYTLMRDVGGYACYFGVYTLVRGIGIRVTSGEEWSTACNGALKAGEDLKQYHDMTVSESTIENIAVDLGWAGLAGAAATSVAYCWRGPFDAMYKIQYGWRRAGAGVFDLRRFLTSPRGLRQVGIGTATWVAYEAAMRLTHYLAHMGQELRALDEVSADGDGGG